MAIKSTGTAQVTAPASAAAEYQTVNLELARIHRFFFKNTLYEKGVVYVFDKAPSRIILSLLDPQGLPVFMAAKARTKLVQIPQELQTVAVKNVAPQEVENIPADVAPVGQLDLGDDDPEIRAKLNRADAELIDTASHSISV